MTDNYNWTIAQPIRSFSLPRYEQLPAVGLYLDQVAKYITELLQPVCEGALTGSMISNYVKKDIIDNPVKKLYSREQIAYLIFIAVAKSVLTMEEIRLLISLQRNSYSPQRAYDYFCNEFENVLQFVFGLKPNIDTIGVDATPEKNILRSTIITVAYRIYLDKNCSALQNEKQS